MKIRFIDWERKIIEEYETDSIQFEKDGVSYTYRLASNNFISTRKIPYENFLGIKED